MNDDLLEIRYYTYILNFVGGLLSALFIGAGDRQETGWERGGVTRQRAPRPGSEPRAAAVRTKPVHN